MRNFIQENKFCDILTRFDFQEVENGQKKERQGRHRFSDTQNHQDRSLRFSACEFLLERKTFVEKRDPDSGKRY